MVAPAQARPIMIGVHLHRRQKSFPGVPPYGLIRAPASKTFDRVRPKGGCRAVMDCCGCPCAGAPNPDWCTSALATRNLLGAPLPGEMRVPAAAQIF